MPTDTPANGGYMAAAYVVAALIYAGYALRLWFRTARALRE